MGGVILLTINSIKSNEENFKTVSVATTNLALCRSEIRGFMLNAWSDSTFLKSGTTVDLENFKEESQKFETNINFLKQNSSGKYLEVLLETENAFKDVKNYFSRICELIKERGFKDLGIEGKMRIAVHKLEKSDLIPDKSCVLVLRKHEKDFILRKDEAYLLKFEKDAEKLNAVISSIPDLPEKEEIAEAAKTYLTLFRKVAEIEKEIGLTRTTGLRGQLNPRVKLAINSLTELTERFDEKNKNLITTIISFITLIFILIIVVVYISLNKLIRPIFEPMQDIQAKAAEISEGNLSVKFDNLRNNIVLKELIGGFEKIIDKFKNTMSQVEGISSRQILTELPLNSKSDDVGLALNKIITQIRVIDEDEKRRTWHNEGLAKFANVLRINNHNESALYDDIIKELVRYLDANQGAMFIIEGAEENDEHLSMKSCYAYNRKKFLQMRVNYGQGLTGSCWAEAESIHLTEVPENYVQITSGLGDAPPTSILIVPIKFNDKVQGILEIAGFCEFKDYQKNFTESIAENIGSAIHNMKTNIKTLSLLQKSQEMTEELRAQEEEMRQNMEELQATQEEMSRMSENLQKELEELKQENQELKSTIVK